MQNIKDHLAPVVLFVYNRPDHTASIVEALARNSLANHSELFIFSDGPKDDEDMKKISAVRVFLDSLERREWFKTIRIHRRDKNIGLANSIINGVTSVINQYHKVIVLEDDLITSADFLTYMNEALEYYRDAQEIWSISASTYLLKLPKDYKHDIYVTTRGCSCGWGTWKDRWESVDWDVKDFTDFKKNRSLRARINRGGLDMAHMLEMQMEGKIDSWAIRWCYAQAKQGRLTVYPVKSRIKNIGFDGSGTHGLRTSRYDTVLQGCEPSVFKRIALDKRIERVFRRQYVKGKDALILRLASLKRSVTNRLHDFLIRSNKI